MAKFHPFIILAAARTCLPQRSSDTQRSSACLAAMLRYLCCILNSSFLANQYSYPARLRRALALTPPCRLLIPLLYKSCFRAAAWSAAPARFTFWQLPRSPHQPINRKQGPPTPLSSEVVFHQYHVGQSVRGRRPPKLVNCPQSISRPNQRIISVGPITPPWNPGGHRRSISSPWTNHVIALWGRARLPIHPFIHSCIHLSAYMSSYTSLSVLGT